MKQRMLSRNGQFVLGVCLASLLTLVGVQNHAGAQDGQGKYITQSTIRLIKLVDAANKAGYALQDNSFSIGGGWVKQGKDNWVGLYTVQLTAGKSYRFLASGDADAKDVDLQIVDPTDVTKVYKEDVDTAADAIVDFTPETTGRYLVRIRLYDSANDLPCVCVSTVMSKN
jgi:hypothetical protein